MSRFLKELLNQPNVIITSRPHASLPPISLDLEVETIGFYPEQVKDYIKMAFTNRETGVVDQVRVNEVQSVLQKHWLVQSLVRIPIQLDALCFTWKEKEAGSNSGTKLDTMTALYQAIEHSLWKKDIKFPRLEKKPEDYVRNAGRSEIKRTVEAETALLECLAFTGLSSDVIDFTSDHRDNISELFNPLKSNSKLSLDDTLTNLSFLRTSDPSSEHRNRNYHFLHLTFQEYFAARYFVQQWKAGKPLEYLELNEPEKRQIQRIEPAAFLAKHKYTARYDILWRFVAGLLGAEGEAETFFRMIEEPRDLLGPTHQRLVMHCLSEVSTEMLCRKSLEDTLSQWLLFECIFTNDSHLAREMEFPERALHPALQREFSEIVAAAGPSAFCLNWDVCRRSFSRRVPVITKVLPDR
ncbi:hypothetical protein F5883DRAFT_22891 [Diaporthe sp. PMI_573]|nr:hypothetical protein F5883DRAFT_22891 [Diaporthaceae sp. PMI_573]